MRATYLSESAEWALTEYFAGSRAAGIPDSEALPAVLAAARVLLHRVLDLTSPEVAAALDLDVDRLLTSPWRVDNEAGLEAEPQALGAAARAAGVEALRVRSSVSAGVNLVVFVDRLASDSGLEAQGLVIS